MGADPTPGRSHHHVVCYVSSEEGSRRAVTEAMRVSREKGGARLTLLHVADSPGRFSGGRTSRSRPADEVAASLRAEARAWLGPLAGRSGAEAVVITADDVPHAVYEWAREQAATLIVVTPRRRDLRRLLSDPPCPVLLAVGPERPDPPAAP
ncbi:universal stress protein [Miltoncostaea marina]|uniref:universal stress protein n=1 Tax=Miltoncostaea marina TaxID=2843215 RepID=UPI001C3D8804|nr:universal stress protein [Miltoncostaea marina]